MYRKDSTAGQHCNFFAASQQVFIKFRGQPLLTRSALVTVVQTKDNHSNGVRRPVEITFKNLVEQFLCSIDIWKVRKHWCVSLP